MELSPPGADCTLTLVCAGAPAGADAASRADELGLRRFIDLFSTCRGREGSDRAGRCAWGGRAGSRGEIDRARMHAPNAQT